MWFLFLVPCLLDLVTPQNVEWDHICVTDPLGRARLHLENNSPRSLVFGIDCTHADYDYYAEVYVPAHTIYTHRVYFHWEDGRNEENECTLQKYAMDNYYAVLKIFDVFKGDEDRPIETYNYTWCTHWPGVEERTRVYTNCECDSDGFVTYHLVNNIDEYIYFTFYCYDIYWFDDTNYDYEYYQYDIEVDPKSRIELKMIHHDWNNREHDQCVLAVNGQGHFEFYYYASDYYGDHYFMDAMTSCHERPYRTEPIAKVIPHCPSHSAGNPEIELRADIPAYAVVHCRNGPAHLSAVNQMSAFIDCSFDQGDDITDACQFNKQDDVEVYSVTVEVGWGLRDRELFLDSKIYTISCVYEAYGESRSSVERVGSTYIAPEAINVFFGVRKAKGVFELKILDVLDRQVHVKDKPLGTLIRLMITETQLGIGFRAHACSASNGITSYSILINGCGDGQILDKREGFYTDGNVALSPYFQLFKLRGGASIWFDCIFTDCGGADCDGTSCDFVGSSPAQVRDFDRFGEFGHSGNS